ncbi:MAG: two-component sensor histidine kinase, partial [Alphaproteobacteria bacterium]|nr:two-component sensor histidine kinase [Alphaproteobacteria bacterium]
AGLGLAVVAEIASLHDSSVTVDNHPDGGAVFRLALSECRIAMPPRSTDAAAELAETG